MQNRDGCWGGKKQKEQRGISHSHKKEKGKSNVTVIRFQEATEIAEEKGNAEERTDLLEVVLKVRNHKKR